MGWHARAWDNDTGIGYGHGIRHGINDIFWIKYYKQCFQINLGTNDKFLKQRINFGINDKNKGQTIIFGINYI